MENQKTYIRPSWDDYFLDIIKIIGERGTCDRGRSGCIIVKDKRIVATGYVGSPIGVPHCDEAGHEMHTVIHPDGSQSRHCLRTTHAEQNAICQAARFGISVDGGTFYTNMTPCYACAKIIINAGIKRVVCAHDYHAGARSRELFHEAKVAYMVVDDSFALYADQKPDANKASQTSGPQTNETDNNAFNINNAKGFGRRPPVHHYPAEDKMIFEDIFKNKM